MKLIDYAAERIIARGYDYYMSDQVLDIEQTDTYEYQGLVAGSGDEPYSVKINVENRQACHCSCPYAADGKVCKHMVALYLAAFPENAEDYECYRDMDWLYDDYDYYDDCDDCENYYDHFNASRFLQSRVAIQEHDALLDVGLSTIYYDELLNEYLDTLSEYQLRELLKFELEKDRITTFVNYLKPRYKEFIRSKGDVSAFIDTLNSRLMVLSRTDDYEWKDYSQPIFRDEEKEKITEIWDMDVYCDTLNDLFMCEPLAVYDEYRWIADSLKTHLPKDARYEFGLKLRDHLSYLKNTGLKINEAKSNVLIAICIIEDLSVAELAELIIKNSKYHKFVQYTIANSNDVHSLYATMARMISEKPQYNKQNIPFLLKEFYAQIQDQEIMQECYLYEFVNNCDTEMLRHMDEEGCLDSFVPRIEKMTKSLKHLVTLYKYIGSTEKLFNLLMTKGSTEELIRNTEFLREKYELELKNYYTLGFYENLTGEKNRKIYHNAARFLTGLAKLKQGGLYIDTIIADLRESQYAKCHALFDEINIASGRRQPTAREMWRSWEN